MYDDRASSSTAGEENTQYIQVSGVFPPRKRAVHKFEETREVRCYFVTGRYILVAVTKVETLLQSRTIVSPPSRPRLERLGARLFGGWKLVDAAVKSTVLDVSRLGRATKA